jgi:hypothetical protein
VLPCSARCRPTCCLAAAAVAGCGLVQLWICGRWLPVRHPRIPLAMLMSRSPEVTMPHSITASTTAGYGRDVGHGLITWKGRCGNCGSGCAMLRQGSPTGVLLMEGSCY